MYEEEFQRASDEDADRVPLKLQPSRQYLTVLLILLKKNLLQGNPIIFWANRIN